MSEEVVSKEEVVIEINENKEKEIPKFFRCFPDYLQRKPEYYEGCTTINETLEKSCELHKDLPMVAIRRLKKTYVEQNMTDMRKLVTREFFPGVIHKKYSEIFPMIKNFACGITSKFKLSPGKCLEWSIALHGCFRNSLQVVTCYANLGYDSLKHVLKETECRVILAEPNSFALLSMLKTHCPKLKNVIYLGKLEKYQILDDDFKFFSYDEILKEGEKESETEMVKPKADDLALIMYTSGSTGVPKGVMVSHKNIVSGCCGLIEVGDFDKNDRYISYLPSAHIMELIFQTLMLFVGATVCYGSPYTLLQKPGGAKIQGDFDAFKPTIGVVVPKILDVIRKGILSKIKSSAVANKLFTMGYAAKKKRLYAGENDLSSFLIDKIMFNKFKARLGGNFRAIACGGSALSQDLNEFTNVCFGVPVNCGYGLTENCLVSVGEYKKTFMHRGNSVGTSWGTSNIILVDTPELNYLSENKQGEIWVSGDTLTPGYYKNEALTNEVTQEIEGTIWFKTGDIGEWDEEYKCLRIIDRKKNLIKISNGEYIALEKIENCYINSDWVTSILIYGADKYDYVTAIVNVNVPKLKTWAEENNHDTADIKKLLKMDVLRKEVLSDLQKVANESKLKSFEIAKNVYLCNDDWTPESGLVTSSMKYKRKAIYNQYMDEITQMYK